MLNGAPIQNIDLENMSTGSAIKVLHATVISQQSHLEALHADVGEIKSLAKSIKFLVSVVPVALSILGGIAYLLAHVKVTP